MTANNPLHKAREALGGIGLAALALIAGGALFLFLVLQPLEERREMLDRQLAGSSRSNMAGAGASQAATKVAALYAHLETPEQTTEILARLHAIGSAAGVELRAADYRMGKSGGRIERYELTLPVAGNYAQIRTFLAKALAEIPALSLDQVTLRKQRANDPLVQAEMRLTLHLVRPR